MIERDLLDRRIDETEFMISDSSFYQLDIIQSFGWPFADHKIHQRTTKTKYSGKKDESLIISQCRSDSDTKYSLDDEDQDVKCDNDRDVDTDQIEYSFEHEYGRIR